MRRHGKRCHSLEGDPFYFFNGGFLSSHAGFRESTTVRENKRYPIGLNELGPGIIIQVREKTSFVIEVS